jgi:hypothetical protein
MLCFVFSRLRVDVIPYSRDPTCADMIRRRRRNQSAFSNRISPRCQPSVFESSVDGSLAVPSCAWKVERMGQSTYQRVYSSTERCFSFMKVWLNLTAVNNQFQVASMIDSSVYDYFTLVGQGLAPW